MQWSVFVYNCNPNWMTTDSPIAPQVQRWLQHIQITISDIEKFNFFLNNIHLPVEFVLRHNTGVILGCKSVSKRIILGLSPSPHCNTTHCTQIFHDILYHSLFFWYITVQNNICDVRIWIHICQYTTQILKWNRGIKKWKLTSVDPRFGNYHFRQDVN